jgi:hypothetical protein
MYKQTILVISLIALGLCADPAQVNVAKKGAHPEGIEYDANSGFLVSGKPRENSLVQTFFRLSRNLES